MKKKILSSKIHFAVLVLPNQSMIQRSFVPKKPFYLNIHFETKKARSAYVFLQNNSKFILLVEKMLLHQNEYLDKSI